MYKNKSDILTKKNHREEKKRHEKQNKKKLYENLLKKQSSCYHSFRLPLLLVVYGVFYLFFYSKSCPTYENALSLLLIFFETSFFVCFIYCLVRKLCAGFACGNAPSRPVCVFPESVGGQNKTKKKYNPTQTFFIFRRKTTKTTTMVLLMGREQHFARVKYVATGSLVKGSNKKALYHWE